MQIPFMNFFESNDYPKFLFVLFLLVWIVVAINPVNRFNWMIENLLIVAFIPFVIWVYKNVKVSNTSYTLFFIFVMLHLVGSYFSYSVPGLVVDERNYYDRFVHFSFGILLVYPIRELYIHIARNHNFWSYYIPIHLVLSLSAVYEILEWLMAAIISPEAAAVFVGTQGDEFDAVKDMTLAFFGSLITMSTAYFTRKKN